jgi:hypothetical protein
MSARRAERKASPLFEIARLLVRLDHVARCNTFLKTWVAAQGIPFRIGAQ